MKLVSRLLIILVLLSLITVLPACGSSGNTRTTVSYGMGYRGYYGPRPWGYYPGYIGEGEVDPDWGVQTADGSWVWLPPHLRSSSAYTASRGHKANHAGWRANCELVDFEHPVLGCVKALRVRAKPWNNSRPAEDTVVSQRRSTDSASASAPTEALAATSK